MNGTRTGLVIVNTGDGKGKTTAAAGAAIRAAGQGLRVLIIQLMKGQPGVGIKKALHQCKLPIRLKQFGRPGFVHSRACEAIDKLLAHQGLSAFRSAAKSRDYDLIVLDEINVAVDFGLLQLGDVLSALKEKPPSLHVILTGRNARPSLLEIADVVTEMKEIKHHYHKGITSQLGIEY
jgi:cob(I)alamin adenosyltransferase